MIQVVYLYVTNKINPNVKELHKRNASIKQD